MEINVAIDSLGALAHDTRLRAFRLLIQAGPQGLPVGEIRDQLDVPGATLSAHLNVLRHAGLVSDQREGRVIRCCANFARMDELIGYLLENCCSGTGCAPATLGATGTACAPPTRPSSRSKK